MILNEDYLNDIELSDEDITDNDAEVLLQYPDFESYNRHLMSDYQRCIVIETSFQEDFFHDKKIWNHTIPNMLNRVSSVLDIYNVEYEIVFRDLTGDEKSMYKHKVENYDVFSQYNSQRFFNSQIINGIYIIIYCNFPKFTYKESYKFIDRLQNTLWKTEDSIEFILFEITIKPCNLNSYYYEQVPSSIILHGGQLLRGKNDDVIHYKQPYKTFFKAAILSFHNTKQDEVKVEKLYRMIKHGNNPFDKSSYP